MDGQQQSTEKPGDVLEVTDTASVARGVVDDHTGIQHAQAASRKLPLNPRGALFKIGSGLVTGTVDDDSSGIGRYSVAGAMFGYALL